MFLVGIYRSASLEGIQFYCWKLLIYPFGYVSFGGWVSFWASLQGRSKGNHDFTGGKPTWVGLEMGYPQSKTKKHVLPRPKGYVSKERDPQNDGGPLGFLIKQPEKGALNNPNLCLNSKAPAQICACLSVPGCAAWAQGDVVPRFARLTL